MKSTTRLVIVTAISAAFLVALRAAPLTGDTPVYASPDFSAPILVTLGAGAEPSPATATSTVALPEGWQAIAITASVDVWVRDSDLNKELDVKPGSTLRSAPDAESSSVGTMVAGDVTELRGIQGKWVQMHITKKTTGYINPTSAMPAAQPAATALAATTPDSAGPTPGAPGPSQVPYAPNQTVAPPVQQPLSVSAQHAAPPPAATTAHAQTAVTATGPIGGGHTYEAKAPNANSASVPRTFEGTFASTRRAFMPRRPYDFQLTAPDGTRLAYLDLAKIVVTEQLENYIGRTVVVIGPIAGVPNTQDIVVKAETLQAK